MNLNKPEFDVNAHIDHLITLSKSIDTSVITLLTGLNASGKSLIRKLLRNTMEVRLGRKPKFIYASQELRTASNPSLGALSSFMHDLEWLATSSNTVHMLEQCLHHRECDYLVLDEPEIGMGEELQLGLVDWLNEQLEGRKHGVLIICHSRILVRGLNASAFINIEGMSKDEWLSRVPVPYSLPDFVLRADELFMAVRDRNNRLKD